MSQSTREREQVLIEYYRAADSGHIDLMTRGLDPDIEVIFGNEPPVRGSDRLVELAQGTTTKLQRARHLVRSFYHDLGAAHVIVELNVEFHRLDGRVVTIPAMSVIHFNADDLIDQMRIYADLTPVWT